MNLRNVKKLLPTVALACVALDAFSGGYQPERWNLAARREFAARRFGIFLHWGLYSNYAQGEWYLRSGGGKALNEKAYSRMMGGFCPSRFDARAWVRVFKDAGARYVTITSRHHDGFSMWPTKVDDGYNIALTPFGRDVLAELSTACSEEGLQFNVYYSLMDWHRKDYPAGFDSKAVLGNQKGDYGAYRAFMMKQIGELIDAYHPGVIWLDGEWDHTIALPDKRRLSHEQDATLMDWGFDGIYDLIHSKKVLVANNNRPAVVRAKEDIRIFERYLPGDDNASGSTADQGRPLEQCEVLQNGAWGYNIEKTGFLTPEEVVSMIVRAAAVGSNLLLNIGPDASGQLPLESGEVLASVGNWMRQNGYAIYGTEGAGFSKDGNVAYTVKGAVKYAIALPAVGFGYPTVSVCPGVERSGAGEEGGDVR